MGNRSTKTLRVGSAMTKSPRLNEIPPNERNGETQTGRLAHIDLCETECANGVLRSPFHTPCLCGSPLAPFSRAAFSSTLVADCPAALGRRTERP